MSAICASRWVANYGHSMPCHHIKYDEQEVTHASNPHTLKQRNSTRVPHPNSKDGVECANHLILTTNELKMTRTHRSSYFKFEYKKSGSNATGLSTNEAHMGRLARFPLAFFERNEVASHQSLAGDRSRLLRLGGRLPATCVRQSSAITTPSHFLSWVASMNCARFPNSCDWVVQYCRDHVLGRSG